MDGVLYEGTGLYGRSDVRTVNLTTGSVIRKRTIDPMYFGEGIAVVDDRVIQLTWKERTGFLYRASDLQFQSSFTYSTTNGEGWGITYDGTNLIVSDGSEYLMWWDPVRFTETRRVRVLDESGRPVRYLNELEWVCGEVFANQWQTDYIFRIDPVSGRVIQRLDMSQLYPRSQRTVNEDVLNGIAVDPSTVLWNASESGATDSAIPGVRVFVTGKKWRYLFELEFGVLQR